MEKIKQIVLLVTDNLMLIELSNYPKVRKAIETMKALEDMERIKNQLLNV